MEKTPKSLRLQIGLFGRTNVGKSSFLNLAAGQDVALTSEVPGTTTDVVEKTMELLPVGPVVFLDTGGLDDRTTLAASRIARTRKVFDRADVIVLIAEPGAWTDFEESVAAEAARRRLPMIVVVNKVDRIAPSPEFLEMLSRKTPHVTTCSSIDPEKRDRYLDPFKRIVLGIVPPDYHRAPALIGDLLPPRGLAVLIVPIDLEAPRGRLILPQVQAIRDLLDHGQGALAVRESEYAGMLERLALPPDLVVCDSQVVDRMTAETPADVPCTTFSILFARLKGDLEEMVRGVKALRDLRDGDRVLIAEACSHHPLEDDIGRIKIPAWLRRATGADFKIEVCAGRDFPADLAPYRAVIHCGACMFTRREMTARIEKCREQGVPVTNYGVCIAFLHGVLDRVLEPFPIDFTGSPTNREEKNALEARCP